MKHFRILILIAILLLTSLLLSLSIKNRKLSIPVHNLSNEIALVPSYIKEGTESLISSTTHRQGESVTLEKIFDGIDSKTSDSDSWSILVGGDVMIGRTVNYKAITYKSFDWPYLKISDLLSKADFTFVNLESPVTENCPIRNDGMIFCGKVNHIESLKNAHISAVSLANNHMLNQGQIGLDTTLDYLGKNNILPVGIKNPIYTVINGHKIALLAHTDIECHSGVSCVDSEKIKSEVVTAKQNSDLVLIMFHWGDEYKDYPNKRQIEIAHLSIDAGADLVLGNHPHVIEPFEVYKDKLIMYSHGNLVFDQMWSQKTREGLLVEYVFNKTTLIDANLHPVLIEDFGQPNLMEGQSKTDKINFVKSITENFAKGTY